MGPIEEKIKILTDPKHHLEIGWGEANSLVDLYRLPLASLERRKRIDTQILPGETFRVLVKFKDWLLVQAEDLACGWLRDRKEINWYLKQKTSSKKLALKWQKVKRLGPGEMITLSISPRQFSQAMEKTCRPLLGAMRAPHA